jgi:hypothetical protein
VPASLGIDDHSYASEAFYGDIRSHLRFSTPPVPLAVLADESEPLSPLSHIREDVATLQRAPRNESAAVELGRELRLFGCIARSRLRDRAHDILRRVEGRVSVEDCSDLIASLAADLDAVTGAWRRRRPDFLGPALPSAVCETYASVDEFLSVAIEETLVPLIDSIDRDEATRQTLASERKRLRDLVLAERMHRKRAGYPSATIDPKDEGFLYRRALLKKFVTSVLWLKIDKEREGQGAIAAAAAGVAMAISLIAAMYQSGWLVMHTWSFVVAGTLTYVLKDRIKEWLKGVITARTSSWLADYRTKIVDPVGGERLGLCREGFGYVDFSRVPADVLALRYRGGPSAVKTLSRPEIVMRYRKKISLRRRPPSDRLHLDEYELTDILRFAVSELMVRADDPVRRLPVYDAAGDRVEPREFFRVYHLNVVVVMHTPKGRTLKRARITFDKRGIRRLEEVQPARAASASALPFALEA